MDANIATRCSRTRLVHVLLILVLAGWSVTTLADLFIPNARRLPDEAISLAGIKQLRLRIAPVPKDIGLDTLSARGIERQWAEKLGRTGFQIVDDEDAPTLSLVIVGFTEPQVPDGVSFCALLELEQPATDRALG